MKQKILQRKQKTRDKLANYENRNISENSENNTVEKDNKTTCTTSSELSTAEKKENLISSNNLKLNISVPQEKKIEIIEVDSTVQNNLIIKSANANFIPIGQDKTKPKITSANNQIVDIHKIKIPQRYTLLKQIGNGSYGVIYKAMDEETKKIVAIKRIVSSNSGLECLLEASIMTSIRHPYINNAIEIQCNEDSLFIIQNLAECDLFDFVRPSSPSEPAGRKALTTKILKKWSWQLCQALYCLHKERIIHGDVKSSNVLIFGENIRLCDFTLSMKHVPGCTYTIPGGTPTNSSPEVFLHKNWDESSDIWSLGCTLYEMVYAKLLFPVQDGENSIDTKRKHLNCIYEYCRHTGQEVPYEMYDIEYTKHRPFDKKASLINDLIDKMLRIDPKERITIKEVFNHPYFKGYDKSVNYISAPNVSVINLSSDLKYAADYYSKYTAEPITIEMAMNIYRSAGKLQNYSTDYVLLCSLLMASKMNPNQKYSMPIKPTAKLYECEREICQRLKFHLHGNLDVPN
jgi:serine/threonine protein kinase